jgi:3-oxoadipate enol-lactonase
MTDVQTLQRTRRGIAWRVDGPANAPALLLLGSLGTTSEIWRPQIQPFASERRVIRLDTRGHGQSDASPGHFTLADLGADALGVLEAAGVGRAAVCGVSLGGMTAIWLAAHAPERISTLVAVSTGLKIGVRATWEERVQQVRAGGTEAVADASMGRWFTQRFRDLHPDVVTWCRAMLSGCPIDGYVSSCGILMDADLHAAAPNITAPTLVIVGREDPVTPPASAREIADHIPGARLLTLEASHICTVELPEEFNDAVLEFLGSR